MMISRLILAFFFIVYTFADDSCDSCIPEINDQSKIERFESVVQESVGDIVSKKVCSFYENFKKSGIQEEPLKQALNFYIKNQSKIKNKRYISIADYSKNSKEKRYYLLDLLEGQVKSYQVSHGSGKVNGVTYGDPNHDGMIDSCKFSDEQLNILNKDRAQGNKVHERWAMTRPGFFTTAGLANSTAHDPIVKSSGAWPMISTSPRLNKLILNGLSQGVNDDALRNGVVMHEAWYNTGSVMGRSFGCPAFRPEEGREIMNKIKGGSLFYAFVPKCSDDMEKVIETNKGWQKTCSTK